MSKKKMSDNYKDNLLQQSNETTIVRKYATVIIISAILILIIGGISGYLYIKSALQPVDPDSQEDIAVEIPTGASTSDIATRLEDNGLIKDDTIFKFYIKFKNVTNLQAGNYMFSPSMDVDDFIQALQKGNAAEEPIYTVTVPEGKTVKEIASIYANKLPFSKKDFLDKVNERDYVKTLISTYPDVLTDDLLNPKLQTPLEGYLFAATYKFYTKDPGVETVINRMVEKTVNVVTPYLEEIADRDLSVHEALTMASLVQKEASSDKQRQKIAGVFYNRLKEDMALRTDPTVLYAIGEHKDKVLKKDLKVDSPYNTYRIHSLPVGPISNFASASLEATVHPADTDYLYFLHDDKGRIHYSETNKEHNQLKEKYID